MAPEDTLVGEDRCWPCTAANAAAGLLVAGVPLAVAWVSGDQGLLVGAGVWAALVLAFTLHHLRRKGYLPGAEGVARRTGLHDRIGPGRHGDEDDDGAGARGPARGSASEGDRARGSDGSRD